MGLLDTFRRTPEPEQPSLGQVLTENRLVDVGPNSAYVMVEGAEDAARRFAEANDRKFAKPDVEIGAAGATSFSLGLREDYNSDLVGETGIRKYMEMTNDAQVRSALRIAKTPIIAGRWFIDPYSNDSLDIEVAKTIEWNLFEGMSTSWPQFLTETLFMMDYGRYSFEKVFTQLEFDGTPFLGWKKLSPRHPIEETEWIYDESDGGPVALRVIADTAQGYVEIPIEKLAVFTFDREAGDMRGKSILRSAYKHWFFKEALMKIDAIQKERHGIGIPVIKLPSGYTNEDKAKAHEIGASLRTNEEAHIVLDTHWELYFARVEGQQVDVIKSMNYHGEMLFHNVVAQFVIDVGNISENNTNQQLFVKSSQFTAHVIADVINKFMIPQLVDWNWEVNGYPKLKVRRLGETTDWRSISFALRNFVGAQLIYPDDQLDEWIRDEMDMPKAHPETQREVISPQNPAAATLPDKAPGPPEVGPPRQSTAGNMKQQAQGTGSNGKVGADKSGRP